MQWRTEPAGSPRWEAEPRAFVADAMAGRPPSTELASRVRPFLRAGTLRAQTDICLHRRRCQLSQLDAVAEAAAGSPRGRTSAESEPRPFQSPHAGRPGKTRGPSGGRGARGCRVSQRSRATFSDARLGQGGRRRASGFADHVGSCLRRVRSVGFATICTVSVATGAPPCGGVGFRPSVGLRRGLSLGVGFVRAFPQPP